MIGNFVPLIYDENDKIYIAQEINFAALKHLAEIGLITHAGVTEFTLNLHQKKAAVSYYNQQVLIEFQKEGESQLKLGKALLSKAGQELAMICDPKPCDGFKDYVVNKWRSFGLNVMDGNNEIFEYMKRNP
jgi:hypothetical protein